MNSIVISPFWQSVDEQWIGTTLVVISLICLVSTTLFVVRYRSLSFFLIASGFIFLAATILAPVADSRSPKMFQLWLMSPGILTSLSLAQIIMASLAVFGSIRQEVHRGRADRLTYKIRSWFVAVMAVLPSPILLVFLFWVEQNLMISTREQVPAIIGLKVAVVVVLLIAMMSFVLSWFNQYQLLTLHLFTGFFLLLSGALLPCLTVKVSVETSAGFSPYTPNGFVLFFILLSMVAVILAGIWRQRHLEQTGKENG